MKNIFYLLLLFAFKSYADSTKYATAKYGNVEVISSTSFYTEKNNKVFILGQYIDLLTKEKKFKKNIQFFFYERLPGTDSTACHKTKKKLTIFFYKYDFDVEKSLNFIENLINNYEKNIEFDNSDLTNIDFNSPIVNKVLTHKIYRPRIIKWLNNKGNISYYFQNNQYVFFNIKDDKKKTIITFKNVFDYESFYDQMIVVFNENDKINFIEDINKPILKSLKIEDYNLPYYPFKTFYLKGGILMFEFFPNYYKERVLCYLINEDKIIQDLKYSLGNVSN
ncbi:hypothetical protein NAT51_19550 [Flavobacterium amniphilum]|uniref:hypothetical protein n=1 Tax=Flavobacterium amniphilum TaxID=1834035 RepID=UPI002029DF82|nr:hypothetical protein [Flavobacterium amniphilum]MCL9807721.1 hypothetical protein [Flavobacterium amniphilum]